MDHPDGDGRRDGRHKSALAVMPPLPKSLIELPWVRSTLPAACAACRFGVKFQRFSLDSPCSLLHAHPSECQLMSPR